MCVVDRSLIQEDFVANGDQNMFKNKQFSNNKFIQMVVDNLGHKLRDKVVHF
jgi:hypothetical protein